MSITDLWWPISIISAGFSMVTGYNSGGTYQIKFWWAVTNQCPNKAATARDVIFILLVPHTLSPTINTRTCGTTHTLLDKELKSIWKTFGVAGKGITPRKPVRPCRCIDIGNLMIINLRNSETSY